MHSLPLGIGLRLVPGGDCRIKDGRLDRKEQAIGFAAPQTAGVNQQTDVSWRCCAFSRARIPASSASTWVSLMPVAFVMLAYSASSVG